MPGSAEVVTAAADGRAVLARAAAAYAEGRMEEAARLMAEVGPEVREQPSFHELAGGLALLRHDAAGAMVALRTAEGLHRRQFGRVPVGVLANIAIAAVALGDADAALAARDAMEHEVVARHRPEDAGAMAAERRHRAQLCEIDERLAALLWQGGRHGDSVAAMVRALAERPEHGGTLGRLRAMLAWQGRTVEALAVVLRMVLLAPEAAGPAADLAALLERLGAAGAARAWHRRVLALDPDNAASRAALAGPEAGDAPGLDAEAQRLVRPLDGLAGAPRDAVWPVALARVLVASRGGAPEGAEPAAWAVLARDTAIAALRRALALRPGQAEATAELAALTLEQAERQAALETLRGALKLAPDNAHLHARLGIELRRCGEAAEAERSFRHALALQPEMPMAMMGLANALLAQRPSAEALPLIERAMVLDPSMPVVQAQGLVGLALMGQQRPAEALAAFDAALAVRPDDADCRFARALALLVMGRYEEGWEAYAWRWRTRTTADAARAPADPLARPDPASWAGRTVLVYGEQGLGDTIQFLRYARMVAASGARVLLEVPAPLKTIAARIPDMAGVHMRGEALPPVDAAVPLLHLPWAFGTTLATIPATVPYLRGDLLRAAQFRRRMMGLPGLRVGLVWSGDPRPGNPSQAAMDRRRSLRLADLAPLAAVPGAVFVSLQKGAPAAQAAEAPPGMILHDWTAELEDFDATASLMTALDLVVSVDTAPAHLAGALGRPVWLLNRFDTDFRWLLGRDDSPWYPTMRLFRQERPGDWGGVVARVAKALRARVAEGFGGG
jgi:tetratricopeptide (TPR) repeat protein